MAYQVGGYKAEIKKPNGDWELVRVQDALDRGITRGRCKECKGLVRLHHSGRRRGIPRAHPEHMPEHPGCSLGYSFDGRKRLSPDPVR